MREGKLQILVWMLFDYAKIFAGKITIISILFQTARNLINLTKEMS